MARDDMLEPVTAQSGTPLYVAAKRTLESAISKGLYKPGDRLPSTQEISRMLGVSLVTSHRALQELEATGAVDRVQGRGTFVADGKTDTARPLRLSLVLQPDASLADYYHGQVLEGMHMGAREADCEIAIVQGPRQRKAPPDGVVLLNPLESQIEAVRTSSTGKAPLLVAGARHPSLPWIDVDNVDLIDQAVQHAVDLGHRRLAFIGGADELSNSRDRRAGYTQACQRLRLKPDEQRDVIAATYRLDELESTRVSRMLAGANRPTAIVAGGYHLALDVYRIAATLGLDVPNDLSVIGVDDPPSATHLDPPLTTVHQPLLQLGQAAVHGLVETIRDQAPLQPQQTLRANLVIRRSSGPAA
jgi:LacI family transcriptional regulator